MPDSEFSPWNLFQNRLAQRGERRLVLLEGDRDRALAWLAELLPALDLKPGLWVGPEQDNPYPLLDCVSARKGRQWLGQELGCLVWDGWSGNPPDSLAALGGTLIAGGLFFWMMPELGAWAGYADPDYASTGLDTAGSHPFAARMASVLATNPDVIRVRPCGEYVLPDLPAPKPGQASFRPGGTDDQQALVEQLVRLGQGHRRRPLVVTADRGRGKSAALGIAAVRLLRAGRQSVVVTAPSVGSVVVVFRHAWHEAFGEYPQHTISQLEMPGGATLQFLSVRDLLEHAPAAEMVMVDEAAAIPAPLLRQVLLGWPRVAFASTVHGYEGSGRGFDVRFRAVLDRETPHWRSATLQQPVRWAPGDPLEDLTRRLFLLDAGAPSSPAREIKPEILRWHPDEAAESELSEAFGLLVEAHYRTSPGDLRQWLDDPHAVSWCVRSEGQLLGVLWATREGGLSAELARDVMLGKRRIRGHLLVQSLASHSGFAEAAQQAGLRIVRVAVVAGVRHQGLGQRLVQAALEYAGAESLDAVGTSFGGSPELVRFWRKCGMGFVRAGLQREASSGEYPVQFLMGTSQAGASLKDRLAGRLAEHWTALLPLNWADMEPELLVELSLDLAAPQPLNEDDQRDLYSFACGYRGFLLSLPVLQKLSLQPGVMRRIRAGGQEALWCRKVLQGWDWPAVQRAQLCVGRRDGEDRLRAVIAGMPEIAKGL